MTPRLYAELAPWYRLLDPVEDHREEAAALAEVLAGALGARAQTLLELGAGAGNNASYLKRRFRCTLTDRSEGMQALSRGLNPECEHALGDMRTLRLGQAFDAVLVHDAVMYLTAEDELRAAAETAYVHTRPGGVALFVPDFVRETFSEWSALHEGQDGGRSMRCLEWAWDPDPGDDTFVIEYGFLLREGREVRAVHDRHVEGLFPRETWLRVLGGAGFRVEPGEVQAGGGDTDLVFLCRRP